MKLEIELPDKKVNLQVENYMFHNIVPIIKKFENEYNAKFEVEFNPPKLIFREAK